MNNCLKKYLNEDNSVNVELCEYIFQKMYANQKYMYDEYKKGFLQPSHNLSKRCGVKIYTKWKFPIKDSIKNIELLYHVIDEKAFKELYDLTIGLNKDLAKLNTFTGNYNHNLLIGAISLFNYDDMYEFIVEGQVYYIKKLNQVWLTKIAKLEQKYGQIQYVMSNKTLDKLYKKLEL